eukprot:m.223237 g.223237  ORF g.223237 m.223237 type:complete len:461 (-) comp10897_c0_seq1:59-1441(-)
MADAEVKEWARNGSFMKKPTSGWLHDDAALSNGDGVYYPVKYVGRVGMTMSMRTLRFEDRTAVTREAITMACESAGLRPKTKRKIPKAIKDCLADEARVTNQNIKLTISTTGIALVLIGTNQVIANHIMPCISFATGGDAVDYDVIGYVAKDQRNVREVHVFDCGHMAPDVMATIGQAFELRFKAFLRKQATGSSMPGAAPSRRAPPGHGEPAYDDIPGGGGLYDDIPGGEYSQGDLGDNPYGELPTGYHNEGPDFDGTAVYDNRGLGSKSGYTEQHPVSSGSGSIRYTRAAGDDYNPIYDNKGPSTSEGIDFGQVTYDQASGIKEYDDSIADVGASGLMRAPGGGELERPLRQEKWFHGPLRREAADMMLRKNGDFLVRENISSPGQYVLSTLQGGNPVHLLLVDPAGRVQTKDMSFNSVSHLINYHLRARIPVVSHGSRILLGDPIPNNVGGSAGVYG